MRDDKLQNFRNIHSEAQLIAKQTAETKKESTIAAERLLFLSICIIFVKSAIQICIFQKILVILHAKLKERKNYGTRYDVTSSQNGSFASG